MLIGVSLRCSTIDLCTNLIGFIRCTSLFFGYNILYMYDVAVNYNVRKYISSMISNISPIDMRVDCRVRTQFGVT